MPLSNKTFIVLGLPKFDGAYESTNYTIAKMLAINNKVFYIDNPYTYKDYFKEKNTVAFALRKPFFTRNNFQVIDTEIDNLKVIITPVVPSLNFLPEGKIYRWFLKYAEKIIVRRIDQILDTHKIKDYIFINSFNFHYPNIGTLLKPILNIYYCVDPLIRDYDKKHGFVSQNIIIQNANLIICTSKQLYTQIKSQNSNTYFVPNAADITISSKALKMETPIWEKLIPIPKPIIGYFGNIERRIDYSLLKDVVSLHANKSFVFVGPQEKEFIPEWFFNTPNIYITGGVPYALMPQVVKGFNVALLPFKKDEVSNTIFPLKLFEYLGAGKPVVAINFNEDLQTFTHNTVVYCTTAKSFANAIDIALEEENSTEKIVERTQVAANNTWKKRIVEIEEIIQKHL
jgi:teichuronic acid biosynthesis glycosyltransferase TuaH